MIQSRGINIKNRANNAISFAKKLYASDDLEATKGNLGKTWNLIGKLTSRNSGNTSNTLEVKAGNKIVRNPVDIEETFNQHLTDIAQVLAEDIPAVEVNPEFYLKGPLKSFSLQTQSIGVELNLSKKIDDKKIVSQER